MEMNLPDIVIYLENELISYSLLFSLVATKEEGEE